MNLFGRNINIPYRKSNPVSLTLIVIITVAFLFSQVHGMSTYQDYYDLGALNGIWVVEFGEWWRLFTVMLLHGGLMHFAFNTFFGIFVLGGALERILGSVKYLIVIILGGLLASMAVVVWDVATESLVPTVGASGAIFAVMGFLLYLVVNYAQFFNPQDAASIKGLVAINVIFTFFGGNISIPGHIGGLIAGYLIAFLFDRMKIIFKYQTSQYSNPYEQPYNDPGSIEDVEVVDDDDDDPFSKYDDYYS